jgi:hypothetical protein
MRTIDSDAIRSGRVPKLKTPPVGVAFWHRSKGSRSESGALQPPADHRRLDGAAGLVIAPGTVDKTAGERQLIGAAVIFAQHLDRLIRWRFSHAIEFGQTPFTRCHFQDSP